MNPLRKTQTGILTIVLVIWFRSEASAAEGTCKIPEAFQGGWKFSSKTGAQISLNLTEEVFQSVFLSDEKKWPRLKLKLELSSPNNITVSFMTNSNHRSLKTKSWQRLRTPKIISRGEGDICLAIRIDENVLVVSATQTKEKLMYTVPPVIPLDNIAMISIKTSRKIDDARPRREQSSKKASKSVTSSSLPKDAFISKFGTLSAPPKENLRSNTQISNQMTFSSAKLSMKNLTPTTDNFQTLSDTMTQSATKGYINEVKISIQTTQDTTVTNEYVKESKLEPSEFPAQNILTTSPSVDSKVSAEKILLQKPLENSGISHLTNQSSADDQATNKWMLHTGILIFSALAAVIIILAVIVVKMLAIGKKMRSEQSQGQSCRLSSIRLRRNHEEYQMSVLPMNNRVNINSFHVYDNPYFYYKDNSRAPRVLSDHIYEQLEDPY